MKKPEKKEVPEFWEETYYGWKYEVGYNQACEHWMAYHKWYRDNLPTEEELQDLISKIMMKYENRRINEYVEIAKAISKRIRGEK